MTNNNTSRFSNRVGDYVRYRPSYPPALITYLQEKFNLDTGKILADVGSGTGISTELFLNAGYAVNAVEPNDEMQAAAISSLSHFSSYLPVKGTAENTTLADYSVDAIIAGQAFHWFDRDKAKQEFKRILKAGGIVILIWNERAVFTPFEKEYDALIMKHARDYIKVTHRNIDKESIDAFFAPAPCASHIFDQYQLLDFEGLKGRLLSSSYMPARMENGYEQMITDLEHLYKKHCKDQVVRINYLTKVYTGSFA